MNVRLNILPLACKAEFEHDFRKIKTMIKLVSILVSAAFLTIWNLTTVSSQDVAGEPLTEPLDQNQLTLTWRNLANEQVMFPLVMANMPVKIGQERQLFVDNYLVAKEDNITRQVHHPVRSADNPVLAPPKVNFNHVVLQDVQQFDEPPRFRMWYASYDDWQTLPTGQIIRFATSYAISNDGVHWERPQLNLYNVEGLAGPNNVVVPYGMMQGIFHDPEEPDPDKRFKALVCVERKNPVVREGYYVHTSPDGIHWKGNLSQTVIASLAGPYSIPQNGIGDTTRFWWDPLRRKYIGDVKFVIYGKQRSRGVMESDDLIHWTRPTPTFLAREDNAEIYGHRGFAYQGMYIGMRWIFLPEYSKRHSSYVELDCSRDGRIWTRVGAGQPFMDFNPRHDTWDASIMRPVSMLEVDDEIWIYYFSAPTELETGNPEYPENAPVEWSVGLAKLPRDRFVSLNASDAGQLTTRPINFQGQRLHVNAAVAEGGELKVEVLTDKGHEVSDYSVSDCVPIVDDKIDMPVEWNSKTNLAGLENSYIRFRFHLKNAKLFSFWID